MKNKIIVKTLIVAVIIVGFGSLNLVSATKSQAAEAPQVSEIVKKAMCRSYYQGGDGRSQAQMVITDKQGNVRKRRFTILRSNMDSNPEICQRQKYYVYMRSPADIRGMSLVVWKNVEEDDDRWLYLPKLDYVGRIAAGDKRTSFVGSDFLYEDISGRSLHNDTHELIRTTDTHYIIRSTPKDIDTVDFLYYEMLVDRDTFVPMEVNYFKANEYIYRKYTVLDIEDIDGYPTVTSSRMSDIRNQRDTIIKFYKVAYALDIPENIYSERYLRKPPRKYF